MEKFMLAMDDVLFRLATKKKRTVAEAKYLAILEDTKDKIWNIFEELCQCNNVFGPEDSKGECDCTLELES